MCANHVWCSDTTLIPVKNGNPYLLAMIDWTTRKVPYWWLLNTLDASFCVEALEQAITKYCKSKIMNMDPGSKYTTADSITNLTKAEIKILMDGRERYLDIIFTEWPWRSLRQRAVYMHEITNGFQAQTDHRRMDRPLQL